MHEAADFGARCHSVCGPRSEEGLGKIATALGRLADTIDAAAG